MALFRSRSWKHAVGAASGALGIGAIALAALAGTASAENTYTVVAGAESSDKAVQINDFIPKPVTINVGDTVTWRVDSSEFHTVSFLSGSPQPEFLAPVPGQPGVMISPAAAFPAGGTSYEGSGVVSSGLLNQGQTYSLSFPVAGTFDYVCLVHPNMKAQVIVKNAGEPADTPAAVEAKIEPHINADLARRALPIIVNDSKGVPTEASAQGIAAGDGDGHVMVAAFLPMETTVHEGDWVTWVNKDSDGTPHTVSFLAGTPAPDVVVPTPQEGGPPMLILNPAVGMPTPGERDSYDGTTFLNSGMMVSGTPGETFSVRFVQAGTFEYLCLLHPWMTGTLRVLPNEGM